MPFRATFHQTRSFPRDLSKHPQSTVIGGGGGGGGYDERAEVKTMEINGQQEARMDELDEVEK